MPTLQGVLLPNIDSSSIGTLGAHLSHGKIQDFGNPSQSCTVSSAKQKIVSLCAAPGVAGPQVTTPPLLCSQPSSMATRNGSPPRRLLETDGVSSVPREGASSPSNTAALSSVGFWEREWIPPSHWRNKCKFPNASSGRSALFRALTGTIPSVRREFSPAPQVCRQCPDHSRHRRHLSPRLSLPPHRSCIPAGSAPCSSLLTFLSVSVP